MGRVGGGGQYAIRSYWIMKKKYAMQSYLQSDIPAHVKRALTHTRIGAHNLAIKRGRKVKARKIRANEQFCRHCKVVVEDDMHFMTQSPLYNQLRVKCCVHAPSQSILLLRKSYSGSY